jgi:FAD:protein FMN transferase
MGRARMIKTTINKPLMGKEVTFVLYNIEESLGISIIEEAYNEALRLQKIFNFYDPSSELSNLNKKREITASKELIEVLDKALFFCKKTNGSYDISLGKQIKQRKSSQEVKKVLCSYKDIEIKNNKIILKHEDVLIDLGSIAKGYITDKLAEFLINQGVQSGLIDSRGDLVIFGETTEIIGIQHPRDDKKTIKSFEFNNSAVATSGDYKQYYGRYNKSHIIGQQDIISATVVTKNLTDADVFATAIFVMNKKDREMLIKESPDYKVFTINKDLKENTYNGFSKLIVNKMGLENKYET